MGHVRIDAMLIEQIDGVYPEPFQRALDGLFDVLRSAVQTDWMRIFLGVNLEPELGRDHHLVTHGSESLAHELFIHERTVTSAVSKKVTPRSTAARMSAIISCLSLPLCRDQTQPHAAKPHGRDFKTPCSEIALLHCDYSLLQNPAEPNGMASAVSGAGSLEVSAMGLAA